MCMHFGFLHMFYVERTVVDVVVVIHIPYLKWWLDLVRARQSFCTEIGNNKNCAVNTYMYVYSTSDLLHCSD